MQVFNREKAIESLVDNDFDCIENTAGGIEHLYYILKNGFQGYDTFTDHELIQECLNRDMPDSMYFDDTEEV